MRWRPSPFLRDILSTGITSVVTMVSLVVVTGWLASGLGPERFGVYALSRRLVSAVTSFSTVPVGVALARALAIAKDERDRLAYVAAGTLFATVPNLLALAVGAAFADVWGRMFFSDAQYAPVLVATLALVVASAFYTVVFARYRGTGEMWRANLWQLWTLAIAPAVVVAALAHSARVDRIVLFTALATFTAAIPLAAWLGRAAALDVSWAMIQGRLRELLRYGLPRVPGGLAFGGLLAIGPFLAPFFGDLRQAGFLVAGQSMMRVVEGGTSAFGLVALPRMAALQARQQAEFIRDRVEDIVAMALHLGLFVSGMLLLWTREIVIVWLGPRYLEAVPLIRVLLLAVVPYLEYSLLRSVIDGLEERAVNTGNTFAACGVTGVLSLVFGWVGWGAFGLALAGSLGFVTLGALSVRYLWRELALPGRHLALGPALALNLLLLVALAGVRALVPERVPPTQRLALGLGLGALAFGAYLFALRRARVRWLAEIEARLVGRRVVAR